MNDYGTKIRWENKFGFVEAYTKMRMGKWVRRPIWKEGWRITFDKDKEQFVNESGDTYSVCNADILGNWEDGIVMATLPSNSGCIRWRSCTNAVEEARKIDAGFPLGYNAVYDMAKRGEVKAKKVGTHTFIDLDDFFRVMGLVANE